MPLDAVVISDLHLGSKDCKVRPIWKLLAQLDRGRIRTQNLIVNGDLFDSPDLSRMSRKHWRVIDFLNYLARARFAITYLRGNHDGVLLDYFFRGQVCDFVLFDSGSRRIHIEHGHVHDHWLNNRFLQWLSDTSYRVAHIIDPTQTAARILKAAGQRWIDYPPMIARRSCEAALALNAFTTCCGHTHSPCYEEVELKNGATVRYANGGSFVELPCSYLSIADGQVRLEEIS